MRRHRAVLSCALLASLVMPVTSFGIWPDPIGARREAIKAAAPPAEAAISMDDDAPAAALLDPSAEVGAQSGAAPAVGAAVAADASAAPSQPAPTQAAAAGAEAPLAEPPPAPALTHLLAENQMVVFYGTPLHEGLGILGKFDAAEAADRVSRMARKYDRVNGDRSAVGALDLIYALAMDEPTENGLYLRYLDDAVVEHYIRVAEEAGVQLILDLQIGRGDILEEVRKIERFLVHSNVHVAIDPEYAVGPYGEPILTPGYITGDQINAVQDYVGSLVRERNLPPKLVVLHQFMDETVIGGDQTREVEEVDLVLNMDAYGALHEKKDKYHTYAQLPYAERDSYNIFLKQDERLTTEQEVVELNPMPDVVFYQ